jgi:predicted Zn-dependent protease
VLEKQNKLDEAEQALRQIVALTPFDNGPRLNLAKHLEASGKPIAARTEYQEVLRTDPQNSQALEALRHLPR